MKIVNAEAAREAKQKRMEEARLRRQALRDKNEKLREGFNGVMSYSIYEQEELDSATQRAEGSAEELEKIAKRLQEDDSIQPNAKQAEYVLSLFYRMAEGHDINNLIDRARMRAGVGGLIAATAVDSQRKDGHGIKLAIDNDTVKSLKRSWEIVKERLQDVFESEYDAENPNRRFAYPKDRTTCSLVDDLLDNKSGTLEDEFLLLHSKVYCAYYGKSESETETEGNNEQ